MKILVLVVAMGLAGCGGAADPAEDCYSLVRTMCSRVVACLPPGSGTEADCREGAYKALSCSKVTRVGANYAQCKAEMASLSCDAVEEAASARTSVAPKACTGVFQ